MQFTSTTAPLYLSGGSERGTNGSVAVDIIVAKTQCGPYTARTIAPFVNICAVNH